MSAKLYIEGGGDSKQLHIECRAGFRRLLEKCGFAGRMPKLVACGSRTSAFGDFATAHRSAAAADYVAMFIDSEDTVEDIEDTWHHLRRRDGWEPPRGAENEQVLMMTTCMETWMVTDRRTLRAHFRDGLQDNALPSLTSMESRPRRDVQQALLRATQACPNAYRKGRRSFELLGKLDPAALREHLPSFARCVRVLGDRL